MGGKQPKQKSTTELKRDSGGKKPKADDTDDTSRSQTQTGDKRPKQKKTSAIPMLMDDDDDDVIITDDKNKDRDYEPPLDEDDDDNYPIDDDDDDDFQEPIPRARKIVVKCNKLSRKKQKTTTDQQVEKSTKSKKDDDDDETISLFQRIVGPEFEVRASQEFEDNTKDKCGNLVEAAGFRATMKMLALELKKAVEKGEAIEETYVDVVRSTIEVTKAMKYPGATSVEVYDILASIKDLKCNAWRKYLKGATIMKPKDIVMDDEVPENEDDLVIQGPILGKESTEAAAEAIHKLPKLLLADTKRQLKNLFEHTMQAHQHAAEASKCLKELHEALPLDVFLRIADSAVRPLVILHIPKTEEVIQKLKETAVQQTRSKPVSGSTNVKDVMIWRNLPQCGDCTTEEEYRPRKMIACIIHKYIRDMMFKEATPTQVVVDEFNLPKTTIHRQIYGKKYPGGGQTLKKLNESDKKIEKASEHGKIAAVIYKNMKSGDKTETDKGKGSCKGSGKTSDRKRSAADIRGASMAEDQKKKRKDRKAKAMEEEEEDEDRPTRAEIAASKPASKYLFIH